MASLRGTPWAVTILSMISATLHLAEPAVNDRRFLAVTGSGHNLVLDDAAGKTGPKPIELVAVALGGCTAFDVINILRKKRQVVTKYEVHVEAEQKSESPQIFTQVRIVHKLTGIDLDAKAVVRPFVCQRRSIARSGR
jgi:putative redox protein